MASAESATPEAGWYPDPSGNGYRWYDGSAWTSDWQGKPGESLKGTSLSARRATSPSAAGTIVGLLSSMAMFLFTFSRWMVLPDGRAYNSYDRGLAWFLTGADYEPFARGVFAHGWLLAIVSLAALFCVVRASRGGQTEHYVVGLGILAMLIALTNLLAFRSGFADISASTGFAPWLTLLTGIAVAASGGMLMANR